MHNVYLNSEDEDHGFKSFSEKFIEICKQHKDEERALAFAFILYDFKNASLHKIINDTEYWHSLNAISGEHLSVFSLHVESDVNKMNSSLTPHKIQNPSKESDILVSEYFGADVVVKYPAVMFFQVHDDQVIDSVLIELDEERFENAFFELTNYIESAVNVLQGVAKKNRGNSQEIFNLIKTEVQGIKRMTSIKKGLKKATSVYEMGSIIMGLGS